MSKKTKFEVPMCDSCQSREKSIFCRLSHLDLGEFNLAKSSHRYRRGQAIFYEGNRPTGLYCINVGKVKVYKIGEDGKEQIVRFAGNGDIIGYRSLLSGEPYSASAEALEESVICAIPESTFFSVLQTNQNLVTRVIQILTEDVRSAETAMMNMAQKPVRERLAEALLFLLETYGPAEDGISLSVNLTREEISSFVGTAPETVIRLLSEFQHDGILKLKGRTISVIDKSRLIKTAHIFD